MDRKKLIERIRALLAKSIENGATEHEAFAAMQKARDLMDRYDIDEDALAGGGEEISQADTERKTGNRNRPYAIRDEIAFWIARYADCKVWCVPANNKITFLGHAADAMFATWLIEALEAFVNRQAVAYVFEMSSVQARGSKRREDRWTKDLFGEEPAQTNGRAKTKDEIDLAQRSFVKGAIDRINIRLKELVEERERSLKTSDGRSLVMLKSTLVEAAFRELGIHLRENRGGSRFQQADADAYAAGIAAGNRASFGRPVGGSNETRLIA
jgi:hypothetical protein